MTASTRGEDLNQMPEIEQRKHTSLIKQSKSSNQRGTSYIFPQPTRDDFDPIC